MKSKIAQIQRDVILLLKKHRRRVSLHILAKDNCSEMSRLVACSLLRKTRRGKAFILKGIHVMGRRGKGHDIVAFEHDDVCYIIDPTVWQFFKFKRNMVVGEVKNISVALALVTRIYKGTWSISEEMTAKCCANRDEWLRVIDINTRV